MWLFLNYCSLFHFIKSAFDNGLFMFIQNKAKYLFDTMKWNSEKETCINNHTFIIRNILAVNMIETNIFLVFH